MPPGCSGRWAAAPGCAARGCRSCTVRQGRQARALLAGRSQGHRSSSAATGPECAVRNRPALAQNFAAADQAADFLIRPADGLEACAAQLTPPTTPPPNACPCSLLFQVHSKDTAQHPPDELGVGVHAVCALLLAGGAGHATVQHGVHLVPRGHVDLRGTMKGQCVL